MEVFLKITTMKTPAFYSSFIYYGRLVSWVTILLLLLEAVDRIPNTTVNALKAIISYCLLLIVLLILKVYFPTKYEDVKWFCTPGNVSLKSWISLMFYVYLVNVPVEIAPAGGPQIISWIFQCVFGMVDVICFNL